jgi:hypothetical protein
MGVHAVSRPILAALLAVAAGLGPALASLTEDEARRAARVFAQALKGADTSLLKPILPARGKVQLRLAHLGPEQGYFSSDQVESLFKNFLKNGSTDSFEILRIECEPSRLAVARGRASITDGEGRSFEVGIHLAFQPEGERWVLREIRETPP